MARDSERTTDAVATRPASAGLASDQGVRPDQTSSTVGLNYVDAEEPWSEWDRIPSMVAGALVDVGCRPEPLFVAGAGTPRVKRRGDEHLQRADAWAVGPGLVVLVDATRSLERAGGRRFRPVGPWRLDIERQYVLEDPRTRTGTVPSDIPDASGAGASSGGRIEDVSFVDIMPAVVRKQILSTVPHPVHDREYLWRYTRDDRPCRHYGGHLRMSETMLIATVAEREITPSRLRSTKATEQALDRAPWTVTTLTARLGPVERVTVAVGSGGRDALSDPGSARRQIG